MARGGATCNNTPLTPLSVAPMLVSEPLVISRRQTPPGTMLQSALLAWSGVTVRLPTSVVRVLEATAVSRSTCAPAHSHAACTRLAFSVTGTGLTQRRAQVTSSFIPRINFKEPRCIIKLTVRPCGTYRDPPLPYTGSAALAPAPRPPAERGAWAASADQRGWALPSPGAGGIASSPP